jgi:hypothetical protein
VLRNSMDGPPSKEFNGVSKCLSKDCTGRIAEGARYNPNVICLGRAIF